MPTFSIQVKGVKEALEMIDAQKVRRAAVSALKRVAQSGRTEVSSAIRDVYNIKKRDLDKRITVSSIDRNNLTGTLTISARGKKIGEGEDQGKVGISLAYFGAKQIKGKKEMVIVKAHQRTSPLFGKTVKTFTVPQHQRRTLKGGGVSAKIFSSGQRTFVKGAFIATMRSGHTGVMRRSSEQKMRSLNKAAIKERAMVSVPAMFYNYKTKALDKLRSRVLEQWPKEFSHALERELSKR